VDECCGRQRSALHGGIDASRARWSARKQLLITQTHAILSCGFFTVDTVLLKRIYVLYFVESPPRWARRSRLARARR
jgi:hypothetical protein